MDTRRRKQASSHCSQVGAQKKTWFGVEVSSNEWEFINMFEQEDLIYRMYKLVGDKWGLIAGRIPGRQAEEIERFWIMRHGEAFANRRRDQKNQ
ncbi:hypothetical protein GQ457_15G019800 [Hibiscus cannabinus]